MVTAAHRMFSYKNSEIKRKLVICVGLGFLFLSALAGLHRQDNLHQYLKTDDKPSKKTNLSPGLKSLPAKSLEDVRNSTLGVSTDRSSTFSVPNANLPQFQRVYTINLPGRTDKLDAMKLTASLSGFNFDVIDGVKGADMLPKSLPGVSQTHI